MPADEAPDFLYVVYIAASPERVWCALTNGEISRIYWAERKVTSDWKQGSPILFLMGNRDDAPDPIRATVVEVDPPHRLVMDWRFELDGHPFTSAWRVTYAIEKAGPEDTRLTVSHIRHEPDDIVDYSLKNGWPAILSSLKSYLETGEPLAITRQWAREKRRPPPRQQPPPAGRSRPAG